MRLTTLGMGALALAACGAAPYPDYFSNPDAAPVITGLSPSAVDGVNGGDEVIIAGSGLAGTTTVVFGTRNAEIVEVGESAILVRVPPFVAGGGAVEVALVTQDGVARIDEQFVYRPNDAEFIADETQSAMLAVVDCPVEAWGWSPADDEYTALWWCGLEMGWLEASGWDGTGQQPGYAGDMSGYGLLSSLPTIGNPVVYGPGDDRPVKRGQFFKYLPVGGRYSITTDRQFDRDIAWVEQRSAMRAAYYSFEADITTEYAPFAVGRVADEAVCFEELPALDGNDNTLFVEGEPAGWQQLDLAYGIEELDGDYYTEGYFSTAGMQTTADGLLTAGPSGVVLEYDDYSGNFAPNVDRWPGGGDFPFGATYKVSSRALEPQDVPRGEVNGVRQLVLNSPDLMSGAEVLDLGFDVEFDWQADGGDQSYVTVDIVVYDTEITDPSTGWFTEIARLSAQGDDSIGFLRLTTLDTIDLPTAEITFDENYDFVGRYAEVTIARHQLRKVYTNDDETESLVIDFVHAVQSPVDLVR